VPRGLPVCFADVDGRRLHRELNLGIEVIDAVVADYELSAVVREYHVYRPTATG
jgi:hypothetical protein